VSIRLKDRYRFTRLLGQGGMGMVLEAQDEQLGRHVAIKLLRADLFNSPSARLRFQAEARSLVQIEHPGVVTVFDSGILEDGTLYLVMERLAGLDLGTILQFYGPGTPRQVARLARQGAQALEAAHQAKIVHRDIKPQNLFLVPSGEGFNTKILDFGVARVLDADVRLTQTGYLIGTPANMAPEQFLGREADARSDFYAFASVAYETLLGRRLVEALDLSEVIRCALEEAPLPPTWLAPWLPPEVDALFAAALDKDPGRRPASLTDWAHRLGACLDVLEGTVAGWPDPIPILDPQARPPSELSSVFFPDTTRWMNTSLELDAGSAGKRL
jgi:serine/threonine protein kinase